MLLVLCGSCSHHVWSKLHVAPVVWVMFTSCLEQASCCSCCVGHVHIMFGASSMLLLLCGSCLHPVWSKLHVARVVHELVHLFVSHELRGEERHDQLLFGGPNELVIEERG